jgi:tellurite resistance protein
MSVADERLLEKVARGLNEPWRGGGSGQGSILSASASVYGARPVGDETTMPTGFDPRTAVLFEAIVESAYLVATADGLLDEDERAAFAQVVLEATGGAVHERQLFNLLTDLAQQVKEDGLEQRLEVLRRAVLRPDHQREVIRIACLLAQVSGGVSEVEHTVLCKIAAIFALPASEVDTALAAVKSALA